MRHGFLDGLQIFGAGVEEKVDVSVDEAGEKRGVAEVDDFGVGRAGNFGADFFDEVAFDENFAGSGDVAGFDVEEACGVDLGPVDTGGGGGEAAMRQHPRTLPMGGFRTFNRKVC